MYPAKTRSISKVSVKLSFFLPTMGSPFYEPVHEKLFFFLHVEAIPTTRKLVSAHLGHRTRDLIIMSEELYY